MEITLTVSGNEMTFDTGEQLNFDIDGIMNELQEAPGSLGWWYTLLSYKEQERDDYKAQTAKMAADKELFLRANTDDLAKQYGKVTEGVIKAALLADEELTEREVQLNELNKQVGILKAMTRGQESRSSLMATAASLHKAELQASVRKMVNRSERRVEEAE